MYVAKFRIGHGTKDETGKLVKHTFNAGDEIPRELYTDKQWAEALAAGYFVEKADAPAVEAPAPPAPPAEEEPHRKKRF